MDQDQDEQASTEPTKSSPSYLLLGGIFLVLILSLGTGFIFRHKIKSLVKPSSQPVQTVPETLSANKESTPSATQNVVEVDYDGNQFSPSSITVRAGTTVKFINQSTVRMSVASNPHPEHTDYPEFDQFKSEFRGQKEYSFTFSKVGTWGYHNHLNLSGAGTIVVTP